MFAKKAKITEIMYANDLVGCLGKLPFNTEFIKHRIVLPRIANLDRWYQSAYQHLMRRYGNNLKHLFSQMPLYHFIYFVPTQLPLIGTLLASADKSGRAYPFVIFRFIEHPLAREFPLLIPLCYENFFVATEILCQHSWQDYSLPQLFAEVDSLRYTAGKISRLDSLENVVAGLKNISLLEFWHLANNGEGDPNLESFINTLLAELLQLKTKLAVGNVSGLALPLISGDTHKVSVIFWLQLLDFLLKPESAHLQIFWCKGNAAHKAMLYIYFKVLQPADLYQLISSDFIDNQFIDVMRLAKNPQNYTSINNLSRMNPKVSLFQTLQHWSQFIKGENHASLISAPRRQ